MFPMGLLASGEKGEVVETRAADAAFGCRTSGHAHEVGCTGCGHGRRAGPSGRIEDMGLRPGNMVEMLTNGGPGPLLVKVAETRIAVSRSLAMKIMVRRKDDESGDA